MLYIIIELPQSKKINHAQISFPSNDAICLLNKRYFIKSCRTGLPPISKKLKFLNLNIIIIFCFIKRF